MASGPGGFVGGEMGFPGAWWRGWGDVRVGVRWCGMWARRPAPRAPRPPLHQPQLHAGGCGVRACGQGWLVGWVGGLCVVAIVRLRCRCVCAQMAGTAASTAAGPSWAPVLPSRRGGRRRVRRAPTCSSSTCPTRRPTRTCSPCFRGSATSSRPAS